MNFDAILPNNIKSLQGYVAGKTIEEVKALYQPKQISKLASNENRLGCSNHVKGAVIESLKEIQDYPDPVSRKLKERLAQKFTLNESEILLTAGSESLISVICRTFFKNGENAVTAHATFVGFFVQASVRGISIKHVPLNKEHKFDVDELLAAVDNQTKMIYLANPNNPTGTSITKEEYSKLIDGLPKDVILINDEAYYEYAISNPEYPNSLSTRRDNVITLRTFSKAYGLAGFRIGFAIAHERLIHEMTKTRLTFEPSTPAQAAALAALNDDEFIKKSVDIVNQGKSDLYAFFDHHEVDYVHSDSNSVLMILDDEQEAIEFTERMLKHGVILRRVNAFGMPNCVRITIGRKVEMDHFKKAFIDVFETTDH